MIKKISQQHLFVVVAFQSLSPVQLFATPWTAACQAPLSSTISRSLLKFASIEWTGDTIKPSHPLGMIVDF